jgi:hypothetical protein
MRSIVVTVTLAVACSLTSCAPGYDYETRPRPVYVQPYSYYGPIYGPRYGYRGYGHEWAHEYEEHHHHE